METKDKDEVIVDNEEETNEEVEEDTEEKPAKADKPKRTPQEEYEYHKGRSERLAKKLGIKDEKVEPVKDTPTEKPNELDYGAKAFLKTYGIQGSDELALVKTFQTRTGDDLDTLVSDEVFLGKLNSLREARASANAIPKGKGRSGESSVTDIDLAVAKFKETGELPSDFETRTKVVDKAVVQPSKSNNALFSGK